MRNTKKLGVVAAALILAAGSTAAMARPDVTEVEPNNSKAQATPATLAAGDSLLGSALRVSSDSTDDYFLVTTAITPGITRYRLVLDPTTPGFVLTIRSLEQVDGMISDPPEEGFSPLVTSSTGTTPPAFVQWYGSGTSAPQLYVGVSGSNPTTAQPYRVTLEAETVTPVDLGLTVTPGAVTITSQDQTFTDTDFWLYDSSFNPIPGAGADDASDESSAQGLIMPTLTAGTYYLAISDYNLANNQVSPVTDGYQEGDIADFAGVTTCSSPLSPEDVSFAITGPDGVQHAFTATKAGPFDIYWAKFTVGNPTPVGCNPADIVSVGQQPPPDGLLTGDDYVAFINAFFTGSHLADIVSVGQQPPPDGLLTGDDYVAFINNFFIGCH